MPFIFKVNGNFLFSDLSQLSAEGAKQKTTRYAGARQRLYQKKSPFSYNGVVQATKIQKEKGDFYHGKSIQ